MNPIICIAGPTASGKTALAVELAKLLNGEVISCDSMQVYKLMDIGTAKPTEEEMQGIPHHMIDVAEPDEDFSVSRYCCMAAPIVDDIVARGKTAIPEFQRWLEKMGFVENGKLTKKAGDGSSLLF